MTTEETSNDCAASRSTDGLEPAVECDGCKRLQTWARTAWQRGYQMGLAGNERVAGEATAALQQARNENSKFNEQMTDAMTALEDENAKLRNALLISTNGLRHCSRWNISEEKEKALITVVMENEALLGSNA